MPDVLSTTDGILDYFAKEAHKRCFLDTIVYFIKSLKDLYAICYLGVIEDSFASSQIDTFPQKWPLSPQQTALQTRFLALIKTREADIFGRASLLERLVAPSTRHDEGQDWYRH